MDPSTEVEDYTEDELANADQRPDGVPEDVWNEFLAEADEYKAGWKADLTKHVRNYDREQGAK